MMLIMLFIIQGAKRGAIISGAIGLIMYFYYQIITIERSHRIRGYLVAIILVSLLSFLIYRTYNSDEFLKERIYSIAEGNSSNRDFIYTTLLNKWYNSESTWNYLFGFGFAASLYLTGGDYYAHNDWLELLSNFGVLGVCIYLSLFYAAIKLIWNNQWQPDKRLLMVTIILIWFFISMVSMWYPILEGYTQAILLAYLIGNTKNALE